ncbi:alpha-latrocrustotoxin-Lt1a-like [Planococcus citri]|uniref:alpha-latrocrustotoxin-Lt1a-like n=1 Tax=Planococcus citri TaxID=170843 RepID=UPI0031F95A70
MGSSSVCVPNAELLLQTFEENDCERFEYHINDPPFSLEDHFYFFPDPYNGTLLDIACRSAGNHKFVRCLLKNGLDPNLVNKITGKAPIHEAVETGDAEMVNELTKFRSFQSANVIDRKGYTPLHIAVKKNHPRCIKILIDNCRRCDEPIDININTRELASPLHLALKEGNKEAACMLLQCPGIDPNLVNEVTGKAPIHEAVETGDAEMVNELTKSPFFQSANVIDRKGCTPLHIAVEKNNPRCIKILIDNCRRCDEPIDININTRALASPLHLALKKGNKEAACVLLQCPGIDLDFQKDFRGFSCRQIVLLKYSDLAKKFSTDPLSDPLNIMYSLSVRSGLEKSGIKFMADLLKDESLLHLACDYGYTATVRYLLEMNVDPNAIYESRIPIMIAAQNGYCDIFEELFRHREIILQVKEYGSVLHYIIKGMLYNLQVGEKRNHYKCLELVLNEIFPANHSKSNNDKPKLDINFVNNTGSTALHLAVLFHDEQVQKSIINCGAHLYQKNYSGEVPLVLIKAEVLSDYLDGCITEADKSTMEKRDLKIDFEYKLFVNPSSKYSVLRGYEMEFFTIIERVPELKKFLKHPAAESFYLHQMELCQEILLR